MWIGKVRIGLLLLGVLTLQACSRPLWHRDVANPSTKPRHVRRSRWVHVSACAPVRNQLESLYGLDKLCRSQEQRSCFVHFLGEGYRFRCTDGREVPTDNGCGYNCR